jgi:hypothetical protein
MRGKVEMACGVCKERFEIDRHRVPNLMTETRRIEMLC